MIRENVRWIILLAATVLMLLGAYPIVTHNNAAMHSLAGDAPAAMMH
jgi:hypothetical protein